MREGSVVCERKSLAEQSLDSLIVTLSISGYLELYLVTHPLKVPSTHSLSL